MLDDDYTIYKKNHTGVVDSSKLLPSSEVPKMLCMQLAGGDVMKYETLYNEYDIVYLWEIYAIKKATEYENPYVKRKKDG